MPPEWAAQDADTYLRQHEHVFTVTDGSTQLAAPLGLAHEQVREAAPAGYTVVAPVALPRCAQQFLPRSARWR